MKKFLILATAFVSTSSLSFAEEATTTFQALPIVVTAEVDNWEADTVYQLPVNAPPQLVGKRVDLTKSYDAYTAAVTRLRHLLSTTRFDATKDQMLAIDDARVAVSEHLSSLQTFETIFVQEKMLFESDPSSYAAQVNENVQAKIVRK